MRVKFVLPLDFSGRVILAKKQTSVVTETNSREADQSGVTQILRKHNLSHSVFLPWKNQFNEGGAKLLQPQYRKVDPELRKQPIILPKKMIRIVSHPLKHHNSCWRQDEA